MTKVFIEALLFASVAINAALLIFFAGVYRKMMNALDEAAFKNLTELLIRYSSKSAFMIIILNIPLIGAIPYYYLYGFGNWWITSALGLWLVAGSIAKTLKLPVYKAIASLKNEDVVQLKEARQKMNMGNLLQATLYSIATILMALGIY
ncbi:hypothetical protein SNE25_30335 [Mucilaginibacter sabulilitoris]|uniref:DUF2269 family protein n=1 Tax=Mucilaginibacter sabulilitoris TaxID=1173583 RepID=A0ABZ0TPG0_9SPHI|nr:hypothetical protein [Mucilaginibacter sabulilitoris]WPU93619.1 hypothetical protein SNE25_30335 [Mucilaginibacter sabulilitoris]